MDINIFGLKNKKILVVGGSGLIGLELSNFLNNLGARVFNLDIKKIEKKIPALESLENCCVLKNF